MAKSYYILERRGSQWVGWHRSIVLCAMRHGKKQEDSRGQYYSLTFLQACIRSWPDFNLFWLPHDFNLS